MITIGEVMKKKINSEEEKKLILDILQYLDTLCRKNSIHYSLGGGSLLGAIRHHGFIPWDDDADLMLARPEYERLIEKLKQEDNERYGIILNNFDGRTKSENDSPYLFAKVYDKRTLAKSINAIPANMGVFVDIFPIDGTPNDSQAREKYLQNMANEIATVSEASIKYYWGGDSVFKVIAKMIIRFPRYLKLHKSSSMLNRLHEANDKMQKYNFYNSLKVCWLGTMYEELYPQEVFSNYVDVDFEGLKLSAIAGHDEYLADLYGEYMNVPPLNKRKHHSFYKFYWR